MTTHQQEALWIGALAVVPMALIVAALCRAAGRPATRHALWLLALLTFVVPGVLVATGLSSVVAGAVLGVPRALAWAFPPERGDAAADSAPAPVQNALHPQAPAPQLAADLPLLRQPLPERNVQQAALTDRAAQSIIEASRLAAAEGPMSSSREGSVQPAPARSGTGPANVADPRSHRHAPEARPTTTPRSFERIQRQRPLAAAPSTADLPAAPTPSAAGVPQWAAWLLTDGLGIRVPGRGADEPVAPIARTAGSDPVASRDGSVPANRDSATAAAAHRMTLPTAPASPPSGSAPAHARNADAPAIIDPIWNAMSSGSVALEAWAASIARAAVSIADIPAPPAALWIAGVLLIVALGGMRTLAGNAAIRRVQPVDRTDRRLVEDLSERLGLRQAPRAYLVKRRISPMVCGGLNARIVLPEALWRTLDLDARRAVLTHELAHLRRRDQWIRVFELLVGIAYWWHPVLWAVRRRIREEADLCCDAWVTTLFPGLRRSYAEALVQTRAYLSMPGAVAPVGGLGMASARSRKFSRRLTMVMTGQSRPRTSPLGVALALAVGAATLVVVPSIAHATLGKKHCPPEQAAVATPAPSATVRAAEAYGLVSRAAGSARATAAPRAAGAYYTGVVAAQNGTPPADVFYGTAVAAPAADQPGSCCAGTPSPDAISPAGRAPIAGDIPLVGELFRQAGTPRPAALDYYVAARNLHSDPLAAAGGDGLEDRVRALEARIEALDASIQRLLMHLESGAHAGAGDPYARASSLTSTSPLITTMRAFNNATQFQVAQEAQQDGEASWQTYSLPEGKLDALWALMSRGDVPIFVGMGEGEISLEGTPSQQRIFAQFLALIHPEGADEFTAGFAADEGASPFVTEADLTARAAREFATREATAADQRALEERAARENAEFYARTGRPEMAAALAEQERALIEHERALAEHHANLQAELSARMQGQREMVAEARRDAQTRQQQHRQQAQEFRRHAADAERRAQEVERRMRSAQTDEQREALEAEVQAWREQADSHRETSDDMLSELDEVGEELDEALAELQEQEVEARQEIEEALAQAREELTRARDELRAAYARAGAAGGAERAINCACTGDCTGEGCEDDCSENCHCRTGTAAPTPPAEEARPARTTRPARPAAPRPMRD